MSSSLTAPTIKYAMKKASALIAESRAKISKIFEFKTGRRGDGGGSWSEDPKLEAAMVDADFKEKLETPGCWFSSSHRTTACYHKGEFAMAFYDRLIDLEGDLEDEPAQTIGPCGTMDELCDEIAAMFPGPGSHLDPEDSR